jgi:hypothetical protein
MINARRQRVVGNPAAFQPVNPPRMCVSTGTPA